MSCEQPPICLLCRLGRIAYPDATGLQKELLQKRAERKISDILLLLERPPCITLGKYSKPENILIPPDMLSETGVAVYASDRGGDVTFHCPGQLVAYPIMNVRERHGFLRDYISDLEETALRVLKTYGIAAERWPEHPGLWLYGKQIGAIGLRLTHGISMHGLSLNVNPDLKSFEVINLCGIPGVMATSIASELSRDVSMDEVERRFIESFSDVFRVKLKSVLRQQLQGELSQRLHVF